MRIPFRKVFVSFIFEIVDFIGRHGVRHGSENLFEPWRTVAQIPQEMAEMRGFRCSTVVPRFSRKVRHGCAKVRHGPPQTRRKPPCARCATVRHGCATVGVDIPRGISIPPHEPS